MSRRANDGRSEPVKFAAGPFTAGLEPFRMMDMITDSHFPCRRQQRAGQRLPGRSGKSESREPAIVSMSALYQPLEQFFAEQPRRLRAPPYRRTFDRRLSADKHPRRRCRPGSISAIDIILGRVVERS